MTEKNRNPEIRFSGFNDGWGKSKYRKTFSNISNNTLSRAELNYDFGLAKNVHYGDILIKFGEILDVEIDEMPYITDDILANKFMPSKLQNGDVIIADAAEDETVGKCTELVNVGEETVVSGLHTIPCRPSSTFASGYLGYYMNSPAYHNQLLRLMQGTKVSSISKTALQDTAISYPVEEAEQCKVSKLFQQLDKLITLHQHKYDKLINVKKSMLEKMFPKSGATVPEIRFKGFTDAWKSVEVGATCEKTYGGGTPNTSIDEYWNGSIDWIQSSDLSGEQPSCVIPQKRITINGLRSSATKLIPENSIAIVTRVGVGKLALMPYKYTTSQDFLSLSDLKINDWFGVYSIWKKIQADLHIVQGTSIKGITKEELLSKVILVPTQGDEQEKIGQLFKELDNLITLHKYELEKLKNIKKSCLSKMFV